MFGSRTSAPSASSSSIRRTRRPVVSAVLAGVAACAAVALFPSQAHAGTPGRFELGVDGDANALLSPSPNNNNLSTMGPGFKVRFGDHFKLRNEALNLTPEIGYAFDHVFAGDQANLQNGVPENMNRIFAGLRVGFGRRIVPTLYAHIGYGFRTVSSGNNAGTIGSDSGLTLDTGVALEIRIARNIEIGPHVEFVYVDVPKAPEWLTFGGHINFLF